MREKTQYVFALIFYCFKQSWQGTETGSERLGQTILTPGKKFDLEPENDDLQNRHYPFSPTYDH